MTNYKKTRRNGRSKRQKGRSLKRNNKKSRKVMRGGGALFTEDQINKEVSGKVELLKVPYQPNAEGILVPTQHTITYKIIEVNNPRSIKDIHNHNLARINVSQIDGVNLPNTYSIRIRSPIGVDETYKVEPTDATILLITSDGTKYVMNKIL